MFDRSKCDVCGDCLVMCHYVDYSREKAVAEFQALLDGQEAEILKECVTCMGCLEYCEKGADPFDLINSTQEKNNSVQVSEKTLIMFDKIVRMPSTIIQGDPDKPVFSICTFENMLSPEITGHKMFEGMPVLKGGDYFCYMGMAHVFQGSIVKDKGKAFIERLNNLDANEIIFIHDECYSMIKKSREEFGYEIRFKPTHILEHMSNYLKENASSVTKLNKKIAYQRPCSSRVSPGTDDMLDEFFELVGVERVSRKYDRKNALCCGGILKAFGQVERGNESQAINLDDAMEHGAEAMVFLCPMCGLGLRGICKKRDFKSFFVVDLFRMALGEIQYPG